MKVLNYVNNPKNIKISFSTNFTDNKNISTKKNYKCKKHEHN